MAINIFSTAGIWLAHRAMKGLRILVAQNLHNLSYILEEFDINLV